MLRIDSMTKQNKSSLNKKKNAAHLHHDDNQDINDFVYPHLSKSIDLYY